MNESIQKLIDDGRWQPIEDAPRDGGLFYVLMDGLPYIAYYDQHNRFAWMAHANVASGGTYRIHKIDGKELREQTEPEGERDYQKQSFLWRRGFEHKATRWRTIPDDRLSNALAVTMETVTYLLDSDNETDLQHRAREYLEMLLYKITVIAEGEA